MRITPDLKLHTELYFHFRYFVNLIQLKTDKLSYAGKDKMLSSTKRIYLPFEVNW